jgi:hypothetical protein
MVLGSNQTLTEMRTTNVSLGVKTSNAAADNFSILKSGSLNLLESSGLVQACNGIVLTFVIIREQKR